MTRTPLKPEGDVRCSGRVGSCHNTKQNSRGILQNRTQTELQGSKTRRYQEVIRSHKTKEKYKILRQRLGHTHKPI